MEFDLGDKKIINKHAHKISFIGQTDYHKVEIEKVTKPNKKPTSRTVCHPVQQAKPIITQPYSI